MQIGGSVVHPSLGGGGAWAAVALAVSGVVVGAAPADAMVAPHPTQVRRNAWLIVLNVEQTEAMWCGWHVCLCNGMIASATPNCVMCITHVSTLKAMDYEGFCKSDKSKTKL